MVCTGKSVASEGEGRSGDVFVLFTLSHVVLLVSASGPEHTLHAAPGGLGSLRWPSLGTLVWRAASSRAAQGPQVLSPPGRSEALVWALAPEDASPETRMRQRTRKGATQQWLGGCPWGTLGGM